MRRVLTAMLLCVISSAVQAAALSRANTSAPAVNCVFDPTCTILVTDTSDTIVLPGGTGAGFLQSRTFVGQPGTQAEGLYGYEYRIDLSEISGTPAPSVVTFAIDFGRVVPLDYNGDGVTEHVYIVTAGGLGSIGPDYADKTGNKISFHFYGGVAAGTSSYFFGMASRTPPHNVTAQITETLTATVLNEGARAPAISPCLGRPDLNDDFTAADRGVLENLELNFIDPCVIGKHYTPGIHGTTMLLPWHRNYIGDLETSLISQGHPEFVPFPKWDSAKPIPPEFQDVDIPDCLNADTAVCSVNAPMGSDGNCTALSNTNIGLSIPAHLQLPALCEYGTTEELTDGGVDVSRPGLRGFHNSGHVLVGGAMGNFHSPSAAIFFAWHGLMDDIWGSWQCNCKSLIWFALDPFPLDRLTPCKVLPCWAAWWPLDDPQIFDPFRLTPTTFKDIRGFGNDGIPEGRPKPIPGKVGGALLFDGVADLLRVPDHPEMNVGTEDLSIDAWVMTKASGLQPIVNKMDLFSGVGFSFFLEDGHPGFDLGAVTPVIGAAAPAASTFGSVRSVSPAGSPNVADGEWHHVAVSVGREQSLGGRLFVDGQVVMTFDPTPASGDAGNTADLLIGMSSLRRKGVPNGFSGALDEIDLLKRILKPGEVAGLYNAGAAGKVGSLAGIGLVVNHEICNGRALGEPGDRVTIPINLNDGSAVAALQVSLSFNPAILKPAGVRLGADTLAAGGWEVISAPGGSGVLQILADSNPPTSLSPGPKEVALVDFDILPGSPVGTTPLSESDCVLSDSKGDGIPCNPCPNPGGVLVRNASSFSFKPIPSPVGVDEFNPLPFPLTVEALDSLGNPATGYSRAAAMSLAPGQCPPDTLQPNLLGFTSGVGGPANFMIMCCPDPVASTAFPLQIDAIDPPLEITGMSGEFTGVAKGDLDASGSVNVLDVTRTTRQALGQGVPAPPSAAFQFWAGNMMDDHCTVDSMINVLDVVRVRNKVLLRPALCPCGGPLPGSDAAVLATRGSLSVNLVREGPRSYLVMVHGAQDLSGLQLEFRTVGPRARIELVGLTAGRGWQATTERLKGQGMRLVALSNAATGVSGNGAVLRISLTGKPKLGAVIASDSTGREVPVR